MPENHIPPEIYQLAKIYHLGEPTARYETLPRTSRHFRFSLYKLYTTVIVIWICLFALLSSIFAFLRAITDVAFQVNQFSAVSTFMIIGIGVLWWHIREITYVTYQKTSLYHCEFGLLGYNEQDKHVAIIPWDKIESVWLQIMPIYS